MYCYQCEQTAKGTGCTTLGVCGKDPATAALQDLLVHATKGISMYAHRAAELGASDPRDRSRDPRFPLRHRHQRRFRPRAAPRAPARRGPDPRQGQVALRKGLCQGRQDAGDRSTAPATWQPAGDLAGLVRQGEELSLTKRQTRLGNDVTGLQELILYGLKGAAAYADHARILGYEDPDVYATFHAALDFLTQENPTSDALLGWVMKAGELNLTVMGLLDAANTSTYGHPEPTTVRVTPIRGKCICVSGHDLKDLEELLKQTEGKGINVYTHGEMLPCHAYPKLKKYKHLVGNYGGAWQDQRKEFDAFPGAILMTTNCIQKPKETYTGRIFTSGLVAWPGVRHIGPDRDFTPVIEAALAAPGFAEDAPEQTITVGFGHHAVLGVADKVIAAVKSGQIRHFFLVGGCDGAKPGRNYYTEFAQKVPKDCVILTLACGKYRFNKLDFGSIDGVPRLLDVGQCNDAYSADQDRRGAWPTPSSAR